MKKKKKRGKKRGKHYLPIILLILVIVAVIAIIAVAFSHRRSSVTLELIGDQVVTTAVGEPYVDEGAAASYRGEDISDEITESDDVDIWAPGTYEVTYFVEHGNRSRKVTRKVEVKDLAAPEIILNGNEIMAVDDLDRYTEFGATAVDDVDGDITDQISISSEDENDGIRIITYTVTDHAGNSTTVTRKLVPSDDVAPVITLNGDETIVMDANQPFDDPGVTVTDSIDGDLSDSVTKTGWVDVYRPDTYTLTYTATDSSGNSASVTRTVIVESVPSTDPGSIYLTFDDGPSLEVTPTILDILDANDIKATFFIIDYTEEELPLIKRMIAEGHTVGIHSYKHIYSLIYQSVDAFMQDIDALWLKLYNDTGYEAFVLRFPGGSVNEWSAKYCVGIMTDLVQLVSEEGWMYMDWNVDSGDSDETTTESASYIIDKTIGQLDPTRKNVVLAHDMELKSTTAQALQSIIDYGKANGYTFKAIQPDTVPIHQPVMN